MIRHHLRALGPGLRLYENAAVGIQGHARKNLIVLLAHRLRPICLRDGYIIALTIFAVVAHGNRVLPQRPMAPARMVLLHIAGNGIDGYGATR